VLLAQSQVMAGTQCRAMVGSPPLMALELHPRPAEIRGSHVQLHLTSSWTSTRRLSLLQRSTPTTKSTRPRLSGARCRMLQFAAAPKWAVSLCDRLETMIFTSELNARAQTMADHHFWNNNYKPVPEMAPTTNLRVTGSIPVCPCHPPRVKF
jgi:hypothetical protein